MTDDRRHDDERLKRVEDKIDKLTEAMVNLVRIESDVSALAHRIARVEGRQDKMDDRVRSVADSEISSSTSSATFERLILFFVSAGVGVLGTVMVMGK